MGRLEDMARDRSDLSDADIEHLSLLVADWTLLSDLALADFVLWLPTWHGGGFVAADMVRPSTAPTVLPDDLVGTYSPRQRHPTLELSYVTGRPLPERSSHHPVDSESVPVGRRGRVIAVLTRHSDVGARPLGSLEEHYLVLADELLAMVSGGLFPVVAATGRTDTPPRVGDGLLRLDAEGIVTLASPNARSAYQRLGLATDLYGCDLAAATSRLARRPGPIDEELIGVASGRVAGGAEVIGDGAVVTLRAVPLVEGGSRTGALVLVRDATEIRRRDRALVGKDATIREIHHRVKNNLQTVAALLRLQERRVDSEEARAALRDAERRVGAIAVVHDVLARSPLDDVDADEVIGRLASLVVELVPNPVLITRTGQLSVLPTDLVTPMAVVVAELLQNAATHGVGPDGTASVHVAVARTATSVSIRVSDGGPGLVCDVDPFDCGRLGLAIVRTLVDDELGGTITLVGDEGGTTAQVAVPLRAP